MRDTAGPGPPGTPRLCTACALACIIAEFCAVTVQAPAVALTRLQLEDLGQMCTANDQILSCASQIGHTVTASSACGTGGTRGNVTGDWCSFKCDAGYGLNGLHSPADLQSRVQCKPSGDGPPVFDAAANCVDIDECSEGNGGCSPGAVCHNTEGSYHCGACSAAPFADGPNGCCNGGSLARPVDVNGDPYGPTRLCCEPGASNCTAGPPGNCPQPGDWVEPHDCMGPPNASRSTVQLFTLPEDATAQSADWAPRSFATQSSSTATARPFCPPGACLIAGTTTLVAIDARDVHGNHDAELSGLCSAGSFTITISDAPALHGASP
eukprot:SAG11_NODE_7293_length_1165_cov_1.635084_1_plen_323_part_01